jgi:hypothetical protein
MNCDEPGAWRDPYRATFICTVCQRPFFVTRKYVERLRFRYLRLKCRECKRAILTKKRKLL